MAPNDRSIEDAVKQVDQEAAYTEQERNPSESKHLMDEIDTHVHDEDNWNLPF